MPSSQAALPAPPPSRSPAPRCRSLTRLLYKSLIYTPDPTAADGRYQIHALLRQFAATELAGAHEEAATADRHSTYYLAFLAAQQQPIMHDAPRAGVQAIQGELDNIRQAWRWGAGHLPAALVEQGALALREFYWLTGLTAEAIDMFTLAAQARRSIDTSNSTLCRRLTSPLIQRRKRGFIAFCSALSPRSTSQ
ncbi:MAG: hypothetical protein R3E79_45815 [Caldilineaceae bacterium]